MRDTCIDLLTPAFNKSTSPIFVDATLGLGGHSQALLESIPNLILIGIDRDLDALVKAQARLAKYENRIHLNHSVFDEITDVVKSFGFEKVDGILFDLGVSSMQLDQSDRGFSYSQDAPLDMRMDRSRGITASEIINSYAPGELVRILRTYGEEKFATRIVENIVKERAKGPLNSTAQLATLIKDSIPAATRRTGGNPAKRTFQALRIETNDELGAVTRAIPQALELLKVGGRLVVMSFQSLEDRIVKEIFAQATTSGTPRDLPIDLPEFAAKFALLVRGSVLPSEAEIAANSRAQSVRLRAIERVAA